MNVVFRVDASVQIGTGHVMRCLTLADALVGQGAACHFICREHPGHLMQLINARGYPIYALPCEPETKSTQIGDDLPALAHAAWLGTSQEADAAQCESIIRALRPDWLVVDHYALDFQWEQRLRPHSKRIMVIDDLADRRHDCDLLLDQTFNRSPGDYQELVPAHCERLCGAQYALLRPEFAEWRDYSLKRRQQVKLRRLLINLGGVDKDNITTKILESLTECPLPKDCIITVVMGPTAPWTEQVKQQAFALPWLTDVRVGVNNMAELMAKSDLAIGAAGATVWERCCLGLPSLLVVLADNQRSVARAMDEQGIAIVVDKAGSNLIVPCDLFQEEQRFATCLKSLTKASAEVTDGLGSSRVVSRLIGAHPEIVFPSGR